MTIQITTSAAIARFYCLSARINALPNSKEKSRLDHDRKLLIEAIALKAGIKKSGDWWNKTLDWMDAYWATNTETVSSSPMEKKATSSIEQLQGERSVR